MACWRIANGIAFGDNICGREPDSMGKVTEGIPGMTHKLASRKRNPGGCMQPNFFAVYALLLSCSAFGLDIAGKVVDKKFAPIAGARICPQNAPANCVQSGQDGTFRFQGTVGLRASFPRLEPAPSSWRAYRPNGQMWFSAQWRNQDAQAGLPATGFSGPVFLRAVPASATEGHASAPGPLSKSAALPALVITKIGYAVTAFQPATETETNDVVLMGGEGETVTLPFNGKTLENWTQIPAASWIVKNGAMASTGAGRGVLYFKDDYADFRVIFSVRQVKYDHKPCVLFFTTHPPEGQKGLDALGGLQWQAPHSSTWDYRPGKNNDGKAYFKVIYTPTLIRTQWSQCELLVNSAKGEARMASCQQDSAGNLPCKATEVLRFKDPAEIGKRGPFAIQMHNGGIFDEYKNITIEANPKSDSLYLTQ
jgi:hypothetical protein